MRALVVISILIGVNFHHISLGNEFVLLNQRGVRVILNTHGIAPYEGAQVRNDFERHFLVQNQSDDELVNVSVTVIDVQTEDQQTQPAVNPANHCWSLGTAWTLSPRETGKAYEVPVFRSSARTRWVLGKSSSRLRTLIETRCTLKSGALLKSRKSISVDVETISESDLKRARGTVQLHYNSFDSQRLNELQNTLGFPEIAKAFPDFQRDYFTTLRTSSAPNYVRRTAHQIALHLAAFESAPDQQLLDHYFKMLLETPKYALSDLRQLDLWDARFVEPLMMAFEDVPEAFVATSIGQVCREHNVRVNRDRLTAALRRNGHLSDSPELPPSPARMRTAVHISILPSLFPNSAARKRFFEYFSKWPRDANGEPVERFRTQTLSTRKGISKRELCKLLATVGNTSVIETDLMPLLDCKQIVWNHHECGIFSDASGRPEPGYAIAPRLCDWACDAILTIVGIRVSAAYDLAAANCGALRLTASGIQGQATFQNGDDRLHIAGLTFPSFTPPTTDEIDSQVVRSGTTISTPVLQVSDAIIRIRNAMLANLRAE